MASDADGGASAPGADHALLSAPRLAELRRHIDLPVLRGLAEECLTELLERLASARSGLAHADLATVAAQAHAMTGIAAGYGMATLATALRELLETARRGDLPAARKAAAPLAAMLHASHAALLAAIAAG